MIESPKNFIEQFQNFIEHIAGVMKTFLTKEVADNYYLGKSEKASSASLADTATKATQDANGNVIPKTYATKSELTSGLATKQPVGDYRTKSELDTIYLGINATAKSAETAKVAESVNETVLNNLILNSYGPGIIISYSANSGSYSFTASMDGLIYLDISASGGNISYTKNATLAININGVSIRPASKPLSETVVFFLNKDDILQAVSTVGNGDGQRHLFVHGYFAGIKIKSK